jgi:AcrR family transcriptional regulator
MTRKNTPDAKKRILDAAIKIFAEKSFEGSRIDEIAAEANVPKSLIYYHFKSKDDILECLMKDFIDEYIGLLNISGNEIKEDIKEKSVDFSLEKFAERIKTRYGSFGMQNADLVRIIFIESLKKSNKEPLLYRIVEALVKTDKKFCQLNGNESERNKKLVTEFFTAILPLCSYLCFNESFCSYFSIDKEEFGKIFLNTITQTHMNFHK